MRCRSPLDKCMRMSDWSQRPLEFGQLFYAAQDAYVTRKTYVIMARWILDSVDRSELEENIALMEKDYYQADPSKRNKDWKKYFVYSIRANKKLRRVIEESVKTCEDYFSVC